jgi:hypothetical protein
MFLVLYPFISIYPDDLSILLGIENIDSKKTTATGFKYAGDFILNPNLCFNNICPTGAGSEIFYPVRNNIYNLGIKYTKGLSYFRFFIGYGESKKYKGSYDIDFYTFPFTDYKPFDFDNIFSRKSTIFTWNQYYIFNKSESYIKQKYYNFILIYNREIYQQLEFIFKIDYEKERYELFNAYNPYLNLYIFTNVHFFYNDYYTIGSGLSYSLFERESLEIKSGILFLISILHFDFYHPLRYLEFIGDNIGNGYEIFLNIDLKINSSNKITFALHKELLFSLTPNFAKGTKIHKYPIPEIQNIIANRGRGPEFQIHREIFKGSIYYEFKI